MKTLKTMTKDERSLLLFLETQAVDHAGKVDGRHMNKDDFETAAKWDAEGFVNFGRVAFENVNEYGAHWCFFAITTATAAQRAEAFLRVIGKWNVPGSAAIASKADSADGSNEETSH